MAHLTSKGFCSFLLRLIISEFFVEQKLCFDSFNTVYCVSKVIRKHTKLNHNNPDCFTNDT